MWNERINLLRIPGNISEEIFQEISEDTREVILDKIPWGISKITYGGILKKT